ncbi:MFS transporter [Paraburkholderia sp. SARCC-3016]|uniref:MFS transporter n=1 Tax=Paraburkholderia sp. SARCC-3016 TaxID=3058611 RepID=UPI00280A0481|nr:MFS transporter [Paraburkholderia sp. SARCC-3016]MDQ7978847.1 MFS transporter [Paraburkholderia sp. SARCC-3016]
MQMLNQPAVASPDATAPRLRRRRWLIAGVLFLAVISAFFDRISVAILFTDPSFQNAMGHGFNPARLGLLMTVFVFAYGVSGVLLSFTGDVFGPKWSIAAGAVVWGVSMALMGVTSSFTAMLCYRALLGIAEGPQFSLTNALVKQWFPPREQARANAMWLVGSPLGSAVGFALTIHLVGAYGWRSSFFAYAALNLLVVLPLVLLLIKDRPDVPVIEQTVAERAADTPYAQQVMQFIRDWRFWALTLFNTCGLTYLWGLNSWLPSYLVSSRHFDLHRSGVYAWLPFVTMFFGMALSSWLSDRLQRRAIVSASALFLAGASMWLVIHMPGAEAAALMIAASSFFWGGGMPPQFALALRILPPRAVSAGIGFHNGIGNVVAAFSPLAIGALIQATGNFNVGLSVLPTAAIIGAASMALLARQRL